MDSLEIKTFLLTVYLVCISAVASTAEISFEETWMAETRDAVLSQKHNKSTGTN